MHISRTLLEIYFGLNLLIAGAHLGDPFNFIRKENVLTSTIELIGKLVGGFPYYVLAFLWAIISIVCQPLWVWLDTHTFIPFYIGFYIQGYGKNWEPETLAALNMKLTMNQDKKDSKVYKRWAKITAMINKRNNYNPAENTSNI